MVLMSYLEVLHAEFIRTFYSMFPGAFPSADRDLNLAELQEIGSMEEALQYLLQREVESVLRHSTKEQIDYMRQRFKLDLDSLTEELDQLVEIALRRNLFVHSDGVVNRTYLTGVPAAILGDPPPALGEVLFADKQYVDVAIDCVFLVGIAIGQQCWRKWEKEHTEKADNLLIDCVYESLVEGRESLVIALCLLARTLGVSSDAAVKVLTVNHAIALKRLDRTTDMESVLETQDWSASSARYRIALLALHEDYVDLKRLLAQAITSDEIKRHEIEEWPLLEGLRGTEHFDDWMQELFPEGSREDLAS